MTNSPASAAPIVYVGAIRDMIQSLYGGAMRHDNPELSKFFSRIAEFNAAGPVQIVGVEGHGGALPQYDVMNRRFPLKVAEHLTQALDKSIFQRPLIRGPFGVNLNALHSDDLGWMLEQMAVAGGADKGHKVIFKLFEAQNRPEEYVASLKLIQALRDKGLNVGVEVSMVISDKPGLNAEHYKGVAQSLLSTELFARYNIDPSIVAGFSLKDMIGGVKSSADAEGSTINARNLTAIAMEAMQKFATATNHSGMYLGWHTHDIGNALNCLLEAGKTFAELRGQSGAITQFQQDVTAMERGFSDLQALTDGHAAQGTGDAMNDKQRAIWSEMIAHLSAAAEQHKDALIDVSNWDKRLLEYGQLASGGLPYVEKNGISPYQKYVASLIGPDGKPVGMQQAGQIVRCLFASTNGLIDNDLGNAHSVTPAMKLLNDLTINTMAGILMTPLFKERVAAGIDVSKPITDEAFVAAVRAGYKEFRSLPAMAYFCTPMPTPVSDEMLTHLRGKLFDHFFPTSYDALQKVDDTNSASMLKHLSEADYLRVREQMAGQLLDREGTKQTLLAAGVPEETAALYAARNVAVNTLPINQGVRPVLASKVRPAVEQRIEAQKAENPAAPMGLSSKDNLVMHASFAALITRPGKGTVLAPLVTELMKPRRQLAKHSGWTNALSEVNGKGANGNGNGHGNGSLDKPVRPGIGGRAAAANAASQSAAVSGGSDAAPKLQAG